MDYFEQIFIEEQISAWDAMTPQEQQELIDESAMTPEEEQELINSLDLPF